MYHHRHVFFGIKVFRNVIPQRNNEMMTQNELHGHQIYSLRWSGIINLCENGDTYLIPTSENTFFENPRSQR